MKKQLSLLIDRYIKNRFNIHKALGFLNILEFSHETMEYKINYIKTNLLEIKEDRLAELIELYVKNSMKEIPQDE
jgi:hypothetical protein